MIGEYRANFEFTEIYGAPIDYRLDKPYKSWGTEIVLPIINTENKISDIYQKNGKITEILKKFQTYYKKSEFLKYLKELYSNFDNKISSSSKNVKKALIALHKEFNLDK